MWVLVGIGSARAAWENATLRGVHISVTTPALLFPAISLLLLAYTNRFLALAALIRQLHARYGESHDAGLVDQIGNLQRRVRLIRLMQELGVLALLLCVAAMGAVFLEYQRWGDGIFCVSLLLLLWSLAVSVREIHISTRALNLQLRDLRACSNTTPQR